MYFIDFSFFFCFFYTKTSVYNSSINTGVSFTKLFRLGLQTASHRSISNWTLHLSSGPEIPYKTPWELKPQ